MSNLDTKVIGKLAEILDKNNLTELEYEDEGCRICLTRDFSGPVTAPASVQQAPSVQVVQTPQPIAPVSETPVISDYTTHPGAIKSPMVGVVYLSSEPGAPNYVKIGDNINVGDTVCLIEAMKTFNPVKADKSGKVTKVFVNSGDPVEYGEPLVIVE